MMVMNKSLRVEKVSKAAVKVLVKVVVDKGDMM